MESKPLRICVPSEMKPALNPIVVTDAQGLDGVQDFLARKKEFVYDVETNITKMFYDRRVRLVQVGDRDEQYLIDLWEMVGRDDEYLRRIQGQDGKHMPLDGPIAKMKQVLTPALDSNTHLKIGQNLQFDYMMSSWCFGIFPWNFWDTNLAEKVRYAGAVNFFEKNFWGLEDLAGRYLGLLISKEESKGFWPETGIEPLTKRQIEYAALDVRLPIAIRQGQIRYLAAENLIATAEVENNAVPAFGDMPINGFFLDKDAWMEQVVANRVQHRNNIAALDEDFIPLVGNKGSKPTPEELAVLEDAWHAVGVDSEAEIVLKNQIKDPAFKELKTELRAKRDVLAEERKVKRAEARKAFSEASKLVTFYNREGVKMEGEAAINYGAPAQILNALYKVPGLNKKTLKNSNDKTMKKIEKKFPIITKVMNYRETKKMDGSYGESFLEHIHPETGRIHSQFNQLAAETGRTSSEDPNLQQIPVRGNHKKRRNCFKARPGWKMITRDLEGCELRIMAEAANEQTWIDAFNRDEDLHELVAFNIAEKLTPGQWMLWAVAECAFAKDKSKCECPIHSAKRGEAKTINFGIAYGKTVYGVMEELGCDEATAQMILNAWHAVNAGISAYLLKSGDHAKMTGESRTLIGRRRLYPKPTFEQARAKLLADWKKKGWDKDALGNQVNPTQPKIMNKLIAMLEAIKRAGMNAPIQGANVDLVKIAAGCGFDKDGKPFLWHHTRRDKQFALLENLVHDELVLESPEEKAVEADQIVDDCLQRAGAVFIHKIRMTTDGHIGECWTK